MTLFRGTFLDTPRRARSRGGSLRAEADGALLVRDGVIAERGALADLRGRPSGRATSSTCAAGWCCPASSTPTCTSRRCA